MKNFLKRGGEVEQIEKGLSGRDNADGPLKPNSMTFDQEKTPRTYVPEVIAAIYPGQKPKPKPTVKKKPVKKPRKQLIYDDFGEPLRWEWVE